MKIGRHFLGTGGIDLPIGGRPPATAIAGSPLAVASMPIVLGDPWRTRRL